jgi:hypothetical protein
MYRRIIVSIGLIVIAATFILTPRVWAAKKRVKFVPAKGVSYMSAKLSRPTNSVVLNLMNLNQISKVSYELSYIATGIPQGVMGTITPSGDTDSRDLYFGTCSKGVCTPHENIVNAQLLVHVFLKTGSTYTKLYKIKI